MSCGTPTVKSIGIHVHNQRPSSFTILREEIRSETYFTVAVTAGCWRF